MQTDVSIVGGGVIGSLMALKLAKEGLSINLIERNAEQYFNDSPLTYGRTIALNLSSIDFLKGIDIWDKVDSNSYSFDRIYVLDSEGSTPLEFNSETINQDYLGKIVHYNFLLRQIRNKISYLSNVNIFYDFEVKSLNSYENKIAIESSKGESLDSSLIVGADGSFSSVRRLLSIPTRSWSYKQKAFVATINTQKNFPYTAFQLFTPYGPIALLPLRKNEYSLIWSVNQDKFKTLVSLSKKEFSLELARSLENKFGNIRICGELFNFPLNQIHAKTYFSERSVLIGDAIHTIHPLAGQGFNLGIADISDLSDRILKERRLGKSIYNPNILSGYESSRKPINLRMIFAMEAFKQGFSNSNPWIAFARNLAFKLTNQNERIRKEFIKIAAGII
tara:strand:+ start:32453 stop:33625 length:1173 start_codon:yes stop_codon:yes gene_type:complete